MRKQALKAVTMLVSIIALAFMTAVASNAQGGGQSLKVDIPFDFVVGDKTLAAGKYAVSQITQDNAGTLVRNIDSKQSVVRLTNAVQSNAPKSRAMLTFHRYGNSYFLAQIWSPGSKEGREILKSRSQRMAERELAKNPQGSELAKNVETVTIFAEIQ